MTALTTDNIPPTKKPAAKKKKKRISKHIQKANKDRASLEKARSTDPALAATSEPVPEPSPVGKTANNKPKKSPGKANSTIKDVKEAAGYVSNWKSHRQEWKFNKNTQSWLIRHMYESDKVSKGSFGILLEYLGGLQGTGAKERIMQEATRRALRYKKYSETDNTTVVVKAEADEDVDMKDESTKEVQFAENTKAAAESTEAATKKKKSKKVTVAPEDEQTLWEALGDHDKRKEYKRARKVLEELKVNASVKKED